MGRTRTLLAPATRRSRIAVCPTCQPPPAPRVGANRAARWYLRWGVGPVAFAARPQVGASLIRGSQARTTRRNRAARTSQPSLPLGGSG